LGGRKGIRPVKTEWWGAGVVICLEQGADLHMTQLMTLPLTVSCFSKIQIQYLYLVPAHPARPGQKAVKRVCVCATDGVAWSVSVLVMPVSSAKTAGPVQVPFERQTRVGQLNHALDHIDVKTFFFILVTFFTFFYFPNVFFIF